MEEAEKTEKPQEGTWGSIEAYPPRIKFETNISKVVTFPENFKAPVEMPDKEGKGVFYLFDCVCDTVRSTIMTSSWTLLKGLKGHEPLAGKTLIITKKNIGGKNMFYIEVPDSKTEEKEETI